MTTSHKAVEHQQIQQLTPTVTDKSHEIYIRTEHARRRNM